MTSTNIVKLNVGGTVFQTSKSTLTKYDSFFKTMFETGIPLEKDEAGCIFIDRSPKHFEKILNFLRDGNVAIPESKVEVQEIEQEAQYYLLTGLVQICEDSKLKEIVVTDRVPLNVGGKLFYTTIKTLDALKNNMAENFPTTKDKAGHFFFDRNPKHFEKILNYIRDEHIPLPDDIEKLGEIEYEAHFYGLMDLRNSCFFKARNIKKAIKYGNSNY